MKHALLMILMAVISMGAHASSANELIEAAEEMIAHDQLILIPLEETIDESDCEGSPCPNEFYWGLSAYIHGLGAQAGYAPLKNLRVEIGYQETADGFGRVPFAAARFVTWKGRIEAGVRFLPDALNTTYAAQEIRDQFQELGYEVRVNFAHIRLMDDDSGKSKGVRFFAVVSSERTDFVPQAALGALFYFRKIKK